MITHQKYNDVLPATSTRAGFNAVVVKVVEGGGVGVGVGGVVIGDPCAIPANKSRNKCWLKKLDIDQYCIANFVKEL